MEALGRPLGAITAFFDKGGTNAEANIEAFDGKQGLDFITTYSTYFAQDLAETPLDKFSPADTPKNRRLKAKGREEDLLLAWRTTERTARMPS